MNEQAFVQLVRVLRKAKIEEFDMWTWERKNQCGTVACAVGHAASDPWFMKQGLRLSLGQPTFKGCNPWHSVEMFFEIPYSQAVRIFSAENYCQIKPRPQNVINRIFEIFPEIQAIVERSEVCTPNE